MYSLNLLIILCSIFSTINAFRVNPISNATLSGTINGCPHKSQYYVNQNVQFNMCMGLKPQDLKNGMSIIDLINSRGYLPTCRIIHLLLWMASEANLKISRDFFVDVGANIGSCSVHMAALGFPVISIDPVLEHVNTIKGSKEINPSFHIEVLHAGIASQDKDNVHARFAHGARNWGASSFEVTNDNDGSTLALKSLDSIVGSHRVSFVKLDCEGCEWAALKGASKIISRVPMWKIELGLSHYTDGNETVEAVELLNLLDKNNFDIFYEHFDERDYYFGKNKKQLLPMDYYFGSAMYNLLPDPQALYKGAQEILRDQIIPSKFNQKEYSKHLNDLIVIDRKLSAKLKAHFLK